MNWRSGAYFIHDNGWKPFKVVVEEFRVRVYRALETRDDMTIYDNNPFLEEQSPAIFIGQSPVSRMTEYSGGHGAKFDGNSILYRCNDSPVPLYCHIGSAVRTFRIAGSRIESFISPVGNSDVPYPYAIDDLGNTYLIIEDTILSPEFRWTGAYDDPYTAFYSENMITDNKGVIPTRKAPIQNFAGIAKWSIGGEEYTMRYVPFPEKEYDRLADGSTMTITDQTGMTSGMSKHQYCTVIADFGATRGFAPLVSQIVHDRNRL